MATTVDMLECHMWSRTASFSRCMKIQQLLFWLIENQLRCRCQRDPLDTFTCANSLSTPLIIHSLPPYTFTSFSFFFLLSYSLHSSHLDSFLHITNLSLIYAVHIPSVILLPLLLGFFSIPAFSQSILPCSHLSHFSVFFLHFTCSV